MSRHDSGQPFALVQISDPHLFADPATVYRGWNTDAALDALLQQLRLDGGAIDALLLTGDLAEDESAAAYARLSQKLAAFAVPCYALPGNHDDPLAMRQHLQPRLLGQAALAHWRLLLLNSRRAGSINGYLSARELERARAFLAQLDRPGLIAVHHPPVPVGSPWMDSLGLDNGRQLMQLAARHRWLRAIVFGHVHQRFDARRRGIRLLGCPSSWRQFLPGASQAREDLRAAPGYRRLWLYAGGQLQTRIHRLPSVKNESSN